MRIVFDISSLKVTAAGTATYIRELLRSMKRIVAPHEIIEAGYEPRFSRSNKVLRTYDTVQREIYWLQKKLPAIVKNHAGHLLHCPAMMAPLDCEFPIVSTIHDVYILKNPFFFSWWHRTYMKFMLPRVIGRSAHLIAVSQFTKNEVLEMFPMIPEDGISVIHPGTDPFYARVSEEDVADFKRRYTIVKPYFLAVSTIEPRKNLKTLLIAFSLRKEMQDCELLIAGAWGRGRESLLRLINKLKLSGRVRILGYIRREDLRLAYNGAEAFVYPSLYEGFGSPVVEAMACGCPVITSGISSLPEVAGDAAIMVNPLNGEELSEAMVSLHGNSEKRLEYQRRGLERAAVFSYDKCADETLRVYAETVQ